MNLMKASDNWSSRPMDQRFWTLEDMYAATLANVSAAREATVKNGDLRVEVVDNDIQLVGRTGNPARLTNWAFRQLSGRAKAPAGYLESLPATLAAQNLNHGLKANLGDQNEPTKLLLHDNGGYFARAVLTTKYTRIWNSDIVERLLPLQDSGWMTPPARPHSSGEFADDLLTGDNTVLRRATKQQAAISLTVQEGDIIGPAGLYASFEDMFAFMIHPDRVIDDGSKGGLMRGFFVWNSEVGKSSFGVMKFLFRGVCGNHIVWNAQDISEISVRHVGSANENAFEHLAVELKKYADSTSGDDEKRVKICREFKLGPNPEKVLDFIFQKNLLGKKQAQQAMDAVAPEQDGDPLTAWGYAQGVTRLSQKEINTDKRVMLDRAAGRILEVAF